MKKPFKSGDWVVSLSDPQKTVFEVAACYFDKMLKMHRFVAHGGGSFTCCYFEKADKGITMQEMQSSALGEERFNSLP